MRPARTSRACVGSAEALSVRTTCVDDAKVIEAAEVAQDAEVSQDANAVLSEQVWYSRY